MRPDESGITALHKAAVGGYAHVCAHLVETGFEPHCEDAEGKIPLHYAAHAGHLPVAVVLFDLCKTVELSRKMLVHRSVTGWMPLHEAAARGHTNVICFLFSKLKAHDLLVQTTNRGSTPLHLATRSGDNGSCVECLLSLLASKKSDFFLKQAVNLTDEWGETPLHWAAFSGNARACEMLLKSGANARSQSKTLLLPIHLAARYGHLAAVRVLMDADISTLSRQAEEGKTPVDEAAANGHAAVVQILIAAVPSIGCPSEWAVKLGHSNVLQTLMEASPTHTRALVQLICRAGNLPLLKDVVFYIEQKGAAELEDAFVQQDISGFSAMHYIFCEGYCHLLQYVSCLDNVSIHRLLAVHDIDGLTPPLRAVAQGQFAIVDEFMQTSVVDAAPDTLLSSPHGFGPLHVAAVCEQPEIVRIFAHNPRFWKWLWLPAAHNVTPLHLAVRNQHIEFTRMLVVALLDCDHSVEVSAVDVTNSSPLMWLLSFPNCSVELTRILAPYTDVTIRDASGENVLHRLAKTNDQESLQIIEGCHNLSAAVNCLDVANVHGMSPVFTACVHNNHQVLESLLKLGYSSKIPLSNATLPIHIAARTGSLRCCELIVGGCPECVLQKGENGMLPIDEARASAHPDVVEFLENAMAAAEVEQQEQGIHISKEGMQSIVVDEQNLPCVLNEVCQMPPSPRKSELFSQILMHNPPITAHLVRSLIECDDSSCLSLVVGCLFSSSISGKVEHAPSRHSQLLDLFAVTSPFLTAAIFAGKDTMQVLLNACERISAETDRRTFTQEQLHVLDDEGHNCLHLACIAKNSIALKLLLDTAHSSDLLNARDTVSGSTPLHCAARAADPNCIRFLLERDMVDPSIVDASGDPALLDLLSSEAVNLDALSTFLSFPRVDRKCTNTVTSQNGLHLAVMHGRLDETIMYQMVPPERKDDLRALINHKDADQQTPLHLACITGEESWISQLVNQWGAPLDSVDCEGVSPLLRFIHDHIDAGMEDKFSRIVKILTSAKTINLADNYGTTPMHIAVQSGSSTAVRLLITLAKGMKPEPTFEFKNIHGVTPASLAKAKRLGEIEQLLTDNKMGQ